jgi:beta-lactamase regulating signal transducer with metallopeptidase domain
MPTFSAFLDRAGCWIFQASWQASVLIGLILVIQGLFHRQLSARWRYRLWLLVVIRLLLPALPASSASLFNLAALLQRSSPPAAAVASATAPPSRSVAPAPGVPQPVTAGYTPSGISPGRPPRLTPALPETASENAHTAAREPVRPWPGSQILVFLWGGGAMIFLARFGVAWFRLARQVAAWPEVTDACVLRLWKSCLAEMGIRRTIGLVLADDGIGPAVTGLTRPRLLVPRNLLAAVTPEELRLVFLHELTHIRCLDIVLQRLAGVLQAVHWFNPVIWWSLRRAEVDRELACDEAVLLRLPPQSQCRYGRLVLKLVQSVVILRPLPGAVGTFLHPSAMKRRIAMIARFRRPPRGASWLAVVFVVVLGLTALTDRTRGENPPGSTPKAESTTTAAEKAVQSKPNPAKEQPDKDRLVLMGLVEDFFMHNARDITARKSLEWGNVKKHADGSRSIRYKFEARIWDKETLISNSVFTFDQDDQFVKFENVKGFPKKKEPKSVNLGTKEGMKKLVEEFFRNNFRDITARKTLEWGEPEKQADGGWSIRYKYEARIWDKNTIINNQIFAYDKNGEFLGFENVEGFPKDKIPRSERLKTKQGMIWLVEDFFQHNFRDVTARRTLEWGEPEKHDDGSCSIRYKYKASIWDKEKIINNQIFTFDKEGNFVEVKNVPGFPDKLDRK